jgi:hypothetical protein
MKTFALVANILAACGVVAALAIFLNGWIRYRTPPPRGWQATAALIILIVSVQMVENEWLAAGLSLIIAGLACYRLYLAMQMDAERFPNRKRS